MSTTTITSTNDKNRQPSVLVETSTLKHRRKNPNSKVRFKHDDNTSSTEEVLHTHDTTSSTHVEDLDDDSAPPDDTNNDSFLQKTYYLLDEVLAPFRPSEETSDHETVSKPSPEKPSTKPAMKRTMTSVGAFSLQVETQTNLSISTCAVLLKNPIRHDHLLSILENKLCHQHYRFRYKVDTKSRMFIEDKEFRVENHVKYVDMAAEFEDHAHERDSDESCHESKVHNPNDDDKLRAVISTFQNVPLPQDRPLWEVVVIENCKNAGVALIFRVHHCIGDGMSLASAFVSICDQSYDDIEKAMVKQLANSSHVHSLTQKGFRGVISKIARELSFLIWSITGFFFVMFKWALEVVRGPDIENVFNQGNVGEEKNVAWLINHFKVDEVKQIAKKYNATINDVMLSCISGGMSLYQSKYRKHDAPPMRKDMELVRLAIPVNVRRKLRIKHLRNKFGFVVVRVPLSKGKMDSIQRLRIVKRRMDMCKALPEPYVAHQMSKLLSILPQRITKSSFSKLGSWLSGVFTNVRGSPIPLTIDQNPIESIIGFVPAPNGTAVGWSLFSYTDSLSITVSTDRKTVSDPQKLMKCVEKEYKRLKKAVVDPNYGSDVKNNE